MMHLVEAFLPAVLLVGILVWFGFRLKKKIKAQNEAQKEMESNLSRGTDVGKRRF